MDTLGHFFDTCLFDLYVFEGAGIAATLIIAAGFVGSLVLLILARILKIEMAYRSSAGMALVTGFWTYVVTFFLLALDYCFYMNEDVLLAIVALVPFLIGLWLLRSRTGAGLGKAAVLSAASVGLGYLISALFLMQLFSA